MTTETQDSASFAEIDTDRPIGHGHHRSHTFGISSFHKYTPKTVRPKIRRFARKDHLSKSCEYFGGASTFGSCLGTEQL